MRIEQAKDLNKFSNVLPKSIEINTKCYTTSFTEKLLKIFETPVSSINEIFCKGSATSARFLSSIAKKVIINLEDYKDEDESECESNDESITDHLEISSGSYL